MNADRAGANFPIRPSRRDTFADSGESESRNNFPDEQPGVRTRPAIMARSPAVRFEHSRSRQFALDSALKDWVAEAERTRHTEASSNLARWVVTIDGQPYGLEPFWLRVGKVSIPAPVQFTPNPYAYERQRETAWQKQDLQYQIRLRQIDSSVTAAAESLRGKRERERGSATTP